MRILPLLLPVALLLPATTATAQKINDVVLKSDGARVRGLCTRCGSAHHVRSSAAVGGEMRTRRTL